MDEFEEKAYAYHIYNNYVKIIKSLIENNQRDAAVVILTTCFVEGFGTLCPSDRKLVRGDVMRFIDRIGDEIFEDRGDLLEALNETTVELLEALDKKHE